MNEKLSKLFSDFCKLKDELNTSNVTEKTVDIIGRFSKAVQNAENIVLDPPKRDTSFDPELHLKSSTYMSLEAIELKGIQAKISDLKDVNIKPKKPVAKKKPVKKK